MFFCSPEAQSIEMNKSGDNTHWINASLAYAFPYKQIWEIDADVQCQSNDTVFYFRVLILVKAGVCQRREQAFVSWTSVEIFMILNLKMIDLNHYMCAVKWTVICSGRTCVIGNGLLISGGWLEYIKSFTVFILISPMIPFREIYSKKIIRDTSKMHSQIGSLQWYL